LINAVKVGDNSKGIFKRGGEEYRTAEYRMQKERWKDGKLESWKGGMMERSQRSEDRGQKTDVRCMMLELIA